MVADLNYYVLILKKYSIRMTAIFSLTEMNYKSSICKIFRIWASIFLIIHQEPINTDNNVVMARGWVEAVWRWARAGCNGDICNIVNSCMWPDQDQTHNLGGLGWCSKQLSYRVKFSSTNFILSWQWSNLCKGFPLIVGKEENTKKT